MNATLAAAGSIGLVSAWEGLDATLVANADGNHPDALIGTLRSGGALDVTANRTPLRAYANDRTLLYAYPRDYQYVVCPRDSTVGVSLGSLRADRAGQLREIEQLVAELTSARGGITASTGPRQALATALVQQAQGQYAEAMAATTAELDHAGLLTDEALTEFAAEVALAKQSAGHALDDAFRADVADGVPWRKAAENARDEVFAELAKAEHLQNEEFSLEEEAANTLWELKQNEFLLEQQRIQTDLARRQVEWDAQMPFVVVAIRDLAASALREELEPLTRFVDWLQTGLDVAGVFDPSPICDGINGVIHLIRGNTVEASLSFVSAIPYAGDIIGKTGKVAHRVGETLKIAKTATSKATDLCQYGRNIKPILAPTVARDMSIAKRGSYWQSGGKVFPTAETTMRGTRVRGKGRGGRTKWEKPDDLNLKAEQMNWIRRRYKELVEQQGLSPEMAREMIEGQILEQKRSPTGPLKRLVDLIFGN